MPVPPKESRGLPEGTRLVHIGLPKTGTTALQVALRRSAARLAEYGVLVPAAGPGTVRAAARDPQSAAARAIGRDLLQAGDVQRAVLSDELLAGLGERGIEQLRELVGPRAHVLVSLRAPAELLPALWQQQLRKGEPETLAAWSGRVLDDPSSHPLLDPTSGGVVGRWSRVVGAEHVTVVVHDRHHPERLFEVVEDLLGVPGGTLPVASRNRRMTSVEAATVADVWARRRAQTHPVPHGLTMRLLDHATTRLLADRQPDAAEPRPALDAVATGRAQDLGRVLVAAVRETRAAVVGDLDTLADAPPADADDAGSGADELSLDAAAALLHGMFVAGDAAIARTARPPARISSARATALPAGTTILHVGVLATGADVVAEAWREARGTLRRVRYPGTRRAHDELADAALTTSDDERAAAVARAVAPWFGAGTAGTTTVLSAERLALADAPRAAAVLDGLRHANGGGRVHVVLTLSAVPTLLARAWERHVTNGGGQPFDEWLRTATQDEDVLRLGGADVLREDDGHDLVGRWTAAAGADDVTVVVERDRGLDTLAVLASLAGIHPRTVPARAVPRALSRPELELIRSFNVELPYRGTVPAPLRRKYVHNGAVAALAASPVPLEDPVVLPSWVVERAQTAGRRLAEQVSSHGVAVVGRLDDLAAVPPAPAAGTELLRATVETAIMGVFDRAVRMAEPAATPPPDAGPPAPAAVAPAPPPVRVGQLPVRLVARELARRALRRAPEEATR